MAQYFARPTQPSANPPHDTAHDQSQTWSLDIHDSSIYVFPNPPSEPPSPGQVSSVSATEFSSFALSPSASHASSIPPTFTPSPLSTPLMRDFDADQWEWDVLDEPIVRSLLVGSEDPTERPDRWEIIARRRALNQYLQSISTLRSSSMSRGKDQQPSKPSTGTAVFTPHPRINIPLLSFFVSLLSVDDGTLDLLTHSSSHSALFLGDGISLLEKDSRPSEKEVENLHGVEKLLMRESEARVLRAGLGVASDPSYSSSNTLLASPLRLTGIWNIVSGLVTNGGKALREILQYSPHRDIYTLASPTTIHASHTRVSQLIQTQLNSNRDIAGTFKKISAAKKTQFARDVAWVALSVRTGYLLDAFALPDPVKTLAALIDSLRQMDSAFQQIVHVYEPSSGQSFLVNASLLSSRIRSVLNAADNDPLPFVLLPMDESPVLLVEPPSSITSLVLLLSESVTPDPTETPPSSLTLPAVALQDAIPLAAILLDYGVAYVPSSNSQTSFLSGVPLDVYEGVVVTATAKNTLLKFSCPEELGNLHKSILGPDTITDKSRRKFEERILSVNSNVRFEFVHNVTILDRVSM